MSHHHVSCCCCSTATAYGDSNEGVSQDSGAGDGRHGNVVEATPQSQEVLDVFAWMESEDMQDPGAWEETLGQGHDGEEEEEAFDPLKERVRELQLDAELQHAHDILQCTQGGDVLESRGHARGTAGQGGEGLPTIFNSQDALLETTVGRYEEQDCAGALRPHPDVAMEEASGRHAGEMLDEAEPDWLAHGARGIKRRRLD